jgi:serine/threonine/tyrosine protein kinase RAD53
MPLQRRVQVATQDAENDQGLLEPSWQMVQHAQENGVRNGKRKLDPQSPLPSVEVENGNPKKPKRVPEMNGPTTRTRAARERGRGDASSPLARLQEAAAGMVVEEEHLEDNEDVEEAAVAASRAPPRKSTRVSPKRGARRG